MFMSCFSFGPLGVIEGDALIARAEAKLLGRADKLIVLADSSKFETRGSMAVCPLSRVHTLITDDKAPETVLDQVRRAGVNVVVVREEGASISSAA
jgi:DeoR family ulaG and ulaABCDEF operon transcriptional repressor